MKKSILFIALLVVGISGKAQISLEHSYPSTSLQTILQPCNLTGTGWHYWLGDYVNKTVKVYDINHSLTKSIALTVPATYTVLGVSNVSDQLFNSDNLLEVCYYYYKVSPISYEAKIINENGTVVQTITNCNYAIPYNLGTNGWKLVCRLDSAGTSSVASWDVYGLPGSIPSFIHNNGGNGTSLAEPFPNPATDRTIIPYSLPNGTNVAEIIISDLNGNEIKRYKVDNAFNTLELTTKDLPAGTYFYQMQATGISSASKKLIVIK
jgi:hypothetical protein